MLTIADEGGKGGQPKDHCWPGGGEGYELPFLADVICEHSAPKGAKTVGQKYVDMQ